ncbi:MerR family transcriptional regulator [Planctomycetota bacterium]
MNMTVGQLARRSGLSRSALLYYDKLGLLSPRSRSGAGYRLYSPEDVKRLDEINRYRALGLPLREIAILLREERAKSRAGEVLSRHLRFLEERIATLRRQHREAALLLDGLSRRPRKRRSRSTGTRKARAGKEADEMVTKERWVEIMKAAGFTEEQMHEWHRQFERLEPEAHEEFLASLGIGSDEVAAIRKRFKE